jgi:hypothetical protein
MTPYILIGNFVMSFMVVPALVFIIRIEHRITRLETKVETMCERIQRIRDTQK